MDIAGNHSKKNTILIVDDDAVNIRLLLEILQNDYRVIVATGGQQALKLLDKHSDIDLMLLDVDMPGMSGFDVLQRLGGSNHSHKIPVIMVTARNQAGDEVQGLELGAVDYISKPISAAVVKARIKTHLSLEKAKLRLSQQNLDLQSALDTSKKAKEDLTQFTAMVGHELRTPVAVLLCEIELLLDGIRQPNQKNLESLKEEVEHFSSLINDMFDLVLAEDRSLKYNKVECQLGSLIHRSYELFQREFSERDISIEVDTKAIETVNFKVDPKRLRQVIDNLIRNTLRYTDENGRCRITTALVDDWAYIRFEDSEPGVESVELNKLFDRLYRVEESRSRSTGGAGLGLAICKTIIKDHSGKIEAKHSELGGLAITIGLPVLSQEQPVLK